MQKLYTTEQLNKFLDERTQLVVYGIGMYGQRLVDYMIETGRSAQIAAIIVTDTEKVRKKYRGIAVLKASDYLAEHREACVIIAISEIYQQEIAEIVEAYTEDYICITDRLHYGMNLEINSQPLSRIRKVDFCVAGFPKCGTTSLFSALEDMESVYLTKNKETVFFDWYKTVENPERILESRYFSDVREGQMVGMIEPSFYAYAKELKQLLGDEVKFVFMIRNPVNALFSMFKMAARTGSDGEELPRIYQNCTRCEEMFTEYLKHRAEQQTLTQMHYAFYLAQFYQLFPREQIKIVLFEELIQNPGEQINDILAFAGVPDRYEGDSLPHENAGDYIMADREGYLLAKKRRDLIKARRAVAPEETDRMEELTWEIGVVQAQYEAAPKVEGLKMTAEQRAMAKEIFDEDVKKMQQLIDRDLTEIWNWR